MSSLRAITPADLRAAAERFRSMGFASMASGHETTALLYLTMARECDRDTLLCVDSGVHTDSRSTQEVMS